MSQHNTPSNAPRSASAHVETNGAHAVGGGHDGDWKQNVVGDDRSGDVKNISWGAVFAGVVTFLAIVILFSLLSTAFGLGGSGVGAAIMGVIALLAGFFGGGWVAGAMGVRAGLVHGFLTWATSVLAIVIMVVMLTLSTAGAIGGVLGSVVSGLGAAAGPAISEVDPESVPTPAPSDVEDAEQAAEDVAEQAGETAEDVAAAARTGAVWGFIGLLLGAILASFAGTLGSRSVLRRREADVELRSAR